MNTYYSSDPDDREDGFYHYSGSELSQKQFSWEDPAPTPEPPRKKNRLFLKILAGVLACVVIAAGSVGAFAALVVNGVITLPTNGSVTEQEQEEPTVKPASIPQVSQADGRAMSLQEVAAKVTPSVVCIQNFRSSAFQTAEAGEGSGIILDTDGFIVTNAHVVEDADALKVVLYDGTTLNAELIGSDTATDLALIKIEADGLIPAEFGNTDELTVGDQMIAIGNPSGLDLSSSVTFGYVSALNRSIETNNGYTVNCIQTDAAINPGNSGGALVNVYGQVVGINSSKIVATGFEGLGFAISVNEALPVIENLREYGYVKNRPVIGISYRFIDEMTSRYYRMPVGLYVGEVTAENAQEAGLSRGDIITKLDGKELNSSSVIAQVLSTKKPGDTISLELYRDGDRKTVSLVLSEYSR